jgi:hypothetical protein
LSGKRKLKKQSKEKKCCGENLWKYAITEWEKRASQQDFRSDPGNVEGNSKKKTNQT